MSRTTILPVGFIGLMACLFPDQNKRTSATFNDNLSIFYINSFTGRDRGLPS